MADAPGFFDTVDLLPALLDAMPDAMVLSTTDGRIVLANAALAALSGYASAELSGTSLDKLVPAGDGRDQVLRRKDGTTVPIELTGKVVRLLGVTMAVSAIRDASERRRAEAAIRESERRWRTLLENVRLAVVVLDRDRRVTYANPFMRRVSGYGESDLLGRDWFALCEPEDTDGKVEEVFERLLARESAAHFVTILRARSGRPRTMAWYNAVLRDPDGRPVGAVCIGEDVTDRRRSQDRLEAVIDVSRAILQNEPVDDVLRIVAQRSRSLVDASVATIVTPDEHEPSTLVVRVAVGERASDIAGERFPYGDSISGIVMRSNEALMLADAAADARVRQPIVRTRSVGPAIFVPLAVGEQAFGTLLVGRSRGARPFADDDRAVIELFASQAAIALEHARYQSEIGRLAVLEDRDRIGRELRAGAIRGLFTAGMTLQSAQAMATGEVAERIAQAVSGLDEIVSGLRSSVFDLHPPRDEAS